MDIYRALDWGVLLDWVSLLLRWTHVVAAIAWIGSSFYFIALDASLRPNARLDPRVSGDTWQMYWRRLLSNSEICRRTGVSAGTSDGGSNGRHIPPGFLASPCW